MRAWGQVARGSEALAIPVRPLERLAIDYFKSRLIFGNTYAIPREFADKAAVLSTVDASTVDSTGIAQAFFHTRRSCSLSVGTVVFRVVNARPEARKVFRSGEPRVTSHVVVRAFHPVVEVGTVPAAWTLVRWDVRAWCDTPEVLSKFLNSFIHCDGVTQQSRVQLYSGVADKPRAQHRRVENGPIARLAQPAPSNDDDDLDLAIVPHVRHGPVNSILADLADDLALGNSTVDASILDAATSEETVIYLREIGAVAMVSDDDGIMQYKINPAGVQRYSVVNVTSMINDVDGLVSWDSKGLAESSKIELLFKLLDTGVRPMALLEGAALGVIYINI